MKIGMILDNEFSGDPRVKNEVIALQNSGFSVFVLCLNYGDKLPVEIYHGAKIVRIKCPKRNSDKMRALTNTLLNVYPYYWAPKITRFIRKFDIDILHIHDLYMFPAGFIAQKNLKKFRKKIPIVGDLHENYVEGLKKYKFANTFPGNILISIPKWEKDEIKWIKKLDHAITVIEEASERYSSMGIDKNKFTVVANYVNANSFKVSDKFKNLGQDFKDHFIISYVGGFDTHRGLESVIKAIPLIKNNIRNVKVILVGRGRNLASLKQLANDLNINNFVDFQGWQVPEKLPSYIEISDICLIPHLKTIHTDNTIPHKLFQYMLMKKPIIATDCNPIKRIINNSNTGLIYKSNDHKQLASKILYLFNNEKVRTDMGNNGLIAVSSKYLWSNAATSLVNLYNKINESFQVN